MIAIVDYGVGNLFSLVSSLNKIGAESGVTSDKEVIEGCEKIILPGVGAFIDAREKLRACGLDKVVTNEAKRGKKILGICLGMQLLFEDSYEHGKSYGLGILKGSVVPISDEVSSEYKIPHIGWNKLSIKKQSPIFKYINDGDYVYFVHSFYVKGCEDSLLATTDYGAELTASVALNNVYGCQFHPEKSGEVGLKILKGFMDL